MKYKIEKNISLKKFAKDIREIADEVEASNMARVGLVTCTKDSRGVPSCFISGDITEGMPELIEEMTEALREVLLQNYEFMEKQSEYQF